MPKYYNPNRFSIELVGETGERTVIKSGQTKYLSDYYDKYVSCRYILKIDESLSPTRTSSKQSPPATKRDSRKAEQTRFAGRSDTSNISNKQIFNVIVSKTTGKKPSLSPSKIVGKHALVDPYAILGNISGGSYKIGNGIAIGVLSYNRGDSLFRCIQSISRYTDLNRTCLFISDDSSTDPHTLEILDLIAKDKRIVVIRNDQNIGISGNTNRLLRCLSRFDHMFICNDDVEILRPNWDKFYIESSVSSGLQHLCYRQLGVYGAQSLPPQRINGVEVTVTESKPHGAFLYITHQCFNTIGYFDERYEKYGMEHVDWSMKPHEFGIQPTGFYDLVGSDRFVKIHSEPTSCETKSDYFRDNKSRFEQRTPREKCVPSDSSSVPSISYIIPCRDTDRSESIRNVVYGIIAQSFPAIDIWLVEQDSSPKLDMSGLKTINYVFVRNQKSGLFNKSLAFNSGVSRCRTNFMVLHDADMISRVNYTSRIYEILQNRESVHACANVLYLNRASTEVVNSTGVISNSLEFERVVDYFEGGSLACRKDTYWGIGGFNEDFEGYGVEDCDFYSRLSNGSDFVRLDEFNLIHMWHSRQDGWMQHHQINKLIGDRLNRMAIPERIALQTAQLKSSGYI